MTEHQRAKAWAKQRGLNAQRLAELSGYSREAIFGFWRGQNSRGEPFPEWVWQRFRCVCAGIDAQVRSGVNFDWEM